jgi:phosphomannomutase / phosphoglucomutase
MRIDPVIFRQYDIRGTVGNDLTEEVAYAVGRAVGSEARQRLGKTPVLAVGRDNRPSGTGLLAKLVAGLTSTGAVVKSIGQAPTPVLYFAIHHLGADGGVQVTGSHNPPEFNGFKMVLGGVPFAGDDIQALRARIERDGFDAGTGSFEEHDVLRAYQDEIIRRIGKLSRPVKVAVDCGNGVPGVVAPALLTQLGADIVPLFCDSDGSFPNHHPDPTVAENLEDLQHAVKERKLELGIAFDGDGDRIGAVDENGDILWGDQLLILYGRDVTQRLGKGQEIIFDVKCSDVLPQALEQAGAKPVMWMTGHSHIKKKMKETGAPLGGEMSGHMFFGKPDYLGFDDALYAAARLLKIVADSKGPVSSFLAGLPKMVATPEIRVDCPEDRKVPVVAAAARHFSAKYPTVTIDGVRWRANGGWGLIRASNTQPILVCRFEAQNQEAVEMIRAEAMEVLAAQGVRLPAS